MNYYGPRELREYNEDGVKEPSGKYHYTRKRGSGSNSRVWPIGYCAGEPPTTRMEYEKRKGFSSPSREYEEGWDSDRADDDRKALSVKQELAERFGEKYHTEGHDTKEEAVECYTEYCLDVRLTLWHEEATELKRWMGIDPYDLAEPVEGDDVPNNVKGRNCRYPDCGTIVARHTALIRSTGLPDKMHLCSDHCNRESIEEFWSAPGEAWGSY